MSRAVEGYGHRRLTPAQNHAVAMALSAGVGAARLAAEYGVSLRTVYRSGEYARGSWMEVRIGDWKAQFIVGEYGPVRCTPWYPA